jgi:hypothetical protein
MSGAPKGANSMGYLIQNDTSLQYLSKESDPAYFCPYCLEKEKSFIILMVLTQ